MDVGLITAATRGAAAAVLLLPLALPAQPACDWEPGRMAGGVEHSRWREADADGRTLVRERGSLATLAWQPTGHCLGQARVAELQAASGRRGYDGQSSTGVPLRTHSDIRRLDVRLGLRWTLGGESTDAAAPWWAGLGLAQQWLWRDIAGSGVVLGYPERFSRWQAEATVGHTRSLGTAWRLQATLRLSAGPGGSLRLHLPQADPATLRTGAGQGLGIALALEPVQAAGWSAQFNWQHRREQAGPAAPLYRSGVLVGGAAQPQVVQDGLGLTAMLRW